MKEYKDSMQIKEDFTVKMQTDVVESYLEYYNLAKKQSIRMSVQVAELKTSLVNIEYCESANKDLKDLPPLRDMKETLYEWCADGEHSIEDAVNKEFVISKLGGIHSPYYDILKNIAETLILGDKEKKKRCLIFHGVHNTGKTTIANYINGIFDCKHYRTQKGIYDTPTTR